MQIKKFFNLNFIYLVIITLIILSGIFLRFHYFINNAFLYMDDCSLAMNILTRNIAGMFSSLDYVQKAPPLFMVDTYLLYICLGMSEWVFRIIPFFASVLSLILFFFVSKSILQNKLSVIFALVLSAININLIYYSQAFKQYSSDILFSLLLLLLFINTDIKKLTTKTVLLYSFLISLMALYSYTVIFIFPVMFLIFLINNHKKEDIKKLFILIIPFCITALYYLIQALLPSSPQNELIHMWSNIENCGFLSLNISADLTSLKQNLIYFFGDVNILLISLLLLSGFIILFKKQKKLFYLFSGIFIVMIICSFAKIYPLSERTILFLFPITVLILSSNIELFELKGIKKIFPVILLGLMIFSFKNYNIEYFKNLYSVPLQYEYTAPRKAIKYIADNRKRKDIFCMVNHISLGQYYFKKYFNEDLESKHLQLLYFQDDEIADKTVLKNYLSHFKKGAVYWIYIAYLPDLDILYSNLLEYFKQNHIDYSEIEDFNNETMHLIKFTMK